MFDNLDCGGYKSCVGGVCRCTDKVNGCPTSAPTGSPTSAPTTPAPTKSPTKTPTTRSPTTRQPTTKIGCDGVTDSGKMNDHCGICGGTNACDTLDCAGTINGTCVVDVCGDCCAEQTRADCPYPTTSPTKTPTLTPTRQPTRVPVRPLTDNPTTTPAAGGPTKGSDIPAGGPQAHGPTQGNADKKKTDPKIIVGGIVAVAVLATIAVIVVGKSGRSRRPSITEGIYSDDKDDETTLMEYKNRGQKANNKRKEGSKFGTQTSNFMA